MSSSSPKHAPWWEAELEVPLGIADDAAALLVADGAAGVETIGDVTPPPTPIQSDAPTRSPPAPGSVLLVATYTTDDDMADADAVIRAVRGAVALLDTRLATATVRVVVRRDASWAERWKEYFTPLQISERLWVVPAWEAAAGFAPPNGGIPLLIEPGMAFGTGQHATTALCLRLLERLIANEPPATLLDVGTGSGILSLAAARLGVERIFAIDNDEAALGVAKDNLELNSGCVGHITFASTPVAEIDQRFELVIANILAHILIDLADGIVATVNDGGRLILSGLLASQREEVLDAYTRASEKLERAPLSLRESITEGEWVVLLLASTSAQHS